MAHPRDPLLEAAASAFRDQGLHRTTVADIAKRAGVSRPTVYKHLGDRDAIAEALLGRELGRFLTALEPVLQRATSVRGLLVEGLVFSVAYARNHPLLGRLIADEPHVALPWLTTQAGPVLGGAVAVLTPHLRRLGRTAGAERVAEWATRLGISLVLLPHPAEGDGHDGLRRHVHDLVAAAPGLDARAADGTTGSTGSTSRVR